MEEQEQTDGRLEELQDSMGTESDQNLAEVLEPADLEQIGADLVLDYLRDREERKEWEEQQRLAREFYFCALNKVDYPWPDASNFSPPFLAEACMNYQARAMKGTWNPRGPALARARGTSVQPLVERWCKVLNYQLVEEADLEEELDFVQADLPLIGSSFLLGDWDADRKAPTFFATPAEDFVVSFSYRGPLSKAARATQLTRLFDYELEEDAKRGFYLPVAAELGPYDGAPPQGADTDLHRQARETAGVHPRSHRPGARAIIQVHTRLRIDGEYRPIIATIDLATKKVLRIGLRVDKQGRELCHAVKYTFLPNPTSATYGIGLGQLLLSPSAGARSLGRQLINQGTLSTVRPLLHAARTTLPEGDQGLEPGKALAVEYNEQGKLEDEFYVPPFTEPSAVLFQMLGMLERYAQRMSSVTDIMQGIAPRGSNTTATEAVALLEMGTVVFSQIHSRTRRALKKTLLLASALDAKYLDDAKYSEIIGTDDAQYHAWQAARQEYSQAQQILMAAQRGMPVPPQLAMQAMQLLQGPPPPEYPYSVQDFEHIPGPAIQPSADPDAIPRAERMQLAEKVVQFVGVSPITAQNPAAQYAAGKYFLEAHGVDDTMLQVIFPQPPPPTPPPDVPAWQENADALVGKPLFVLPDQDHRQHLGEHELFATQSPEGKRLAPEGRDALERHMREHAAFLVRQTGEARAQAQVPRPLTPPPGGPPPGPGVGAVEAVGADAVPPAEAGEEGAVSRAPTAVRNRFGGIEGVDGQ